MTTSDAQILESTYRATDTGNPSVAARAEATVRALRRSGWTMARIRAAAAAAGWAPELVGAPGEPTLNARGLITGAEQQREQLSNEREFKNPGDDMDATALIGKQYDGRKIVDVLDHDAHDDELPFLFQLDDGETVWIPVNRWESVSAGKE